MVESAGGHGTGRPVTGSKHPSVTFPAPVRRQGACPRVFEVNQPFPHEDRQPAEKNRIAAPSVRALRRDIEEDLVERLRSPRRVT
jgi:hypothetical protein